MSIILGLVAAVGPFAIDMYLPAMPEIGRDLGVDQQAVQWTIVGYFITFGLAQLAYGPWADQAGRKPPLYVGLVLFILGTVVTVGIFLLLFVAFGTARDALLVMLNLPLAMIGGVIGVFVAGGILSVASIIGFITLFGIATRNGVMMISHIHHLVEHEGIRDSVLAVTRGAEERLVPILMTALAAGLALVPLALAAGEPGSEIQAPMAIVILFGLASSTLLNMVVVPALYLRFGAVRGLVARGFSLDTRPVDSLLQPKEP